MHFRSLRLQRMRGDNTKRNSRATGKEAATSGERTTSCTIELPLERYEAFCFVGNTLNVKPDKVVRPLLEMLLPTLHRHLADSWWTPRERTPIP